MTFGMAGLSPSDELAPPDSAWGPMIVVALLVIVVAVAVAVVGFSRIARRRGPDATAAGLSPPAGEASAGDRPASDLGSTSEDPLPTDPSDDGP